MKEHTHTGTEKNRGLKLSRVHTSIIVIIIIEHNTVLIFN